MAWRFCMETGVAACVALGASIWGVQSTAPATLTAEDVAPPHRAASVEVSLVTVIEPIHADSLGLGERSQSPDVFHRAGLEEPIPDTRDASNGAAEEVASVLPSAHDGS